MGRPATPANRGLNLHDDAEPCKARGGMNHAQLNLREPVLCADGHVVAPLAYVDHHARIVEYLALFLQGKGRQ